MFELSDSLIGIYKTNDSTKTVHLDADDDEDV